MPFANKLQKLGVHPDYCNAMSSMVKFLFVLALIQFIALLLPAWPNSNGIPNYIPWHYILEAISIVISMLVFAVGWNSHSKNLSGNVVLLASVFFSVGAIDFFHTATYVGMPEFFSANDAQKHLNYWLSARILAAVVLLVIAVRAWKPLASRITRYAIFGLLVIFTLSLHWAVTYHQSWFPDTFIPGQGLTRFKKNLEYMIIMINLVTAVILLNKMRKPQPFKVVMLFGAVCTLVMSEYFFTIYTTMLGSYNILGHIYKVIAYLLIYRTIVVEVIEEPYNLLIAQVEDITKRKQAEHALKVSEERYRLLFDTAIVGVLLTAPDGSILEANPSACDMFQRTEEEMRQVGRSGLMDTSDPRVAIAIEERDKTGKFYGELTFIRKDGTQFPGEISSAVFKDKDGNRRTSMTIRDISERKQAEDVIHRERNFTSAVLDTAGVLVVVINREGEIVRFNRAAEEFTGYSFDEVKGIPFFWDRFLLSEQRTGVRGVFEGIRAGEITPYYENYWVGKGGNKRLFAWANTLLFDYKNKMEFVIAVGTDLSERRKMEGALSRSENNLRTLIHTIPDLIWMKDAEGVYLSCNYRFEQFFGKAEKDIIGHTDYDFVDKEIADSFREYDRIALMSDSPSINEEWATFKNDGHRELLETTKKPVFDDHGELVGILGVSHDITQRKQAEIELRIAATAFESHEGMCITDARGIILRVNRSFTDITGYSAEEVIGQNPRILKSGHQDVNFYTAMWQKINSTGAWEGEIWNRRKNGEIYPEHITITAVKDEKGIVTNYVSTLIDITLSKAAADEIKHLAFYDPLTRLPNRRLLLDRLRQALSSMARNNKSAALLFIDLDNFKILNDTLGHDIGDILLQQVAIRLESCVREGDTVARLGGDEFVVMLEGLSKDSIEAAEQTETIGRKILLSLNQIYQLGSHEHHNTPSIGATLFNNNSQSIDDIMKQADIAMYQSKKAGRNTLRFFDPQMQEMVDARASMEADLRKALEKNELEVFYQPIVVSKTGKIIKAEALLRWKHPTRGLIGPATFIPLAEESGLILEIGEWVFMQAINTIEHWKNETGQLIQVSVNKSPVQFIRAERQPWLERLANSGLPRGCIAVEITEGLLITDSDKVRDELLSFQKQGIEVSIDDFGTGFSALSYLNQFDIDYLKIDISFIKSIVENESNRALTEAIIVMAHKLGIKTIAEGVETEAQRDLLIKFDCDYIQGFLFSKPLTAAEFTKLLRH